MNGWAGYIKSIVHDRALALDVIDAINTAELSATRSTIRRVREWGACLSEAQRRSLEALLRDIDREAVMSNRDNHRRNEQRRSEHGPHWENGDPGKGCNSTHVARGRRAHKRVRARAERRTRSVMA